MAPRPVRRALLLAAALWPAAQPASAAAQPAAFTPVTDAMLQDPDPADWLMWRRTLDSWGYSPLDQIDRGNVDELRTSVTSPAPKFLLGGAGRTHLYHNSTLALDADTGRIVSTSI